MRLFLPTRCPVNVFNRCEQYNVLPDDSGVKAPNCAFNVAK